MSVVKDRVSVPYCIPSKIKTNMAGMFFARAATRCPKGSYSSFFKKSLKSNGKKIKLCGSDQRTIHSLSQRGQTSILALTNRINLLQSTLTAQTAVSNTGGTSIMSNLIKINGLHTTSACMASGTDAGDDISAELGGSITATTDIVSCDHLPKHEMFPETPPSISTEDIFASNLAEVPLTELGLGGYTPVGLIQNLLDFLHLTVGLPWWCAIIGGTIALRALVFPLMIKGQVNTAKLSQIKPELDRLQEKMRDVSNLQNPMAKAQVSIELQDLFKKHDCHPVKGIISPLIQLPMFISFFLALRGMSYLPVESLRTGGLLWFPDLVNADPFYVLPVITAATMLLTIETGAEAGMANPQMKNMKNVFRGMCVIMVPLTYNFPCAIFLYWLTSNAMSLAQVIVLKIPSVKTYFNVPEKMMTLDPAATAKQGSFWQNLKAGYSNAQEAAIVRHEEKMKVKKYEESLKSSTYKETFEYNPRLKENEHLFEKAKRK